MEALANLNGQLMPLANVRISPLDRGFLFGDAVYEVLRVYGGKPFLMDGHLRRLTQSLEAIRIAGVDIARLQHRILETVAAGSFAEAMIYIQVTRGAAPRSHPFPGNAVPLELLFVEEFQDHAAELRRRGVRVCSYPDIRWKRCDIKSTNLLGNVLAAQAAREAGAYEAIFQRSDGTITEGARTNLFGVREGRLWTAPADPAILPGITRSFVLQLANDLSVPLEERHFTLRDLASLSELFLTGTTSEVMPVIQVDDQQIADGQPGPITQGLQQAYRQAIRRLAG